jgi:thiol-disulfide isomerase/thioredoxin
MRKTLLIGIGLGVLIAAGVWITQTAQTQPTGQQALSDDIKTTLKTLPHLQGAPVTDATLAQKVVVVTFFASWCQPCREEFAHLRQMHETYHGSGLEIVAVNYFENFDNLSDEARLQKYLALTQPPFTVVKGNDTISAQFGTITRIPTLFIFDRQGRQALRFQNEPDGRQPTLDLATLRHVIAPLL